MKPQTLEDRIVENQFMESVDRLSDGDRRKLIISLYRSTKELEHQAKLLMARNCGMPDELISQYIGRDSSLDAIELLWKLANDPALDEEVRAIVRAAMVNGGLVDEQHSAS